MNPFDPVFFHAALNPLRPAIAYTEGLSTFGMLAEAINKAAGNLLALNFKKGDRIACEIRDPFLHFIVAGAISRIGAVGLSLQTDLEINLEPFNIAGSLVDQTSRVQRPRGIIVDNRFYLQSRMEHPFSNRIPGAPFASGDVWRIALSSGSTGLPKAIPFTLETAEKRLSRFNAGESGGAVRTLSFMGFSTAWGIGSVLNTLRNGGLASFAPEPDQALDLAMFYDISDMVMSPQQLTGLVQVQRTKRRAVPALRSIQVGGAKVPEDILRDAQRLLSPGIFLNYGATESGRVTAMHSNFALEAPQAVGHIFPWINVDILRGDGSFCGFDEEGEIRVSGDSVITTYIRDGGPPVPQGTGDWFHPGDLAVRRRDGVLLITGRIGTRINRQGVKMSPEALEERINQTPGVADSCVCAFETKSGTVTVVAGIILAPGATIEAVGAACASSLPTGQTPDEFVAVPHIPRGGLGKIDREPAKAIVKLAFSAT